MTDDIQMHLAESFADLERRSFRTFKARLCASRRLAARSRAWNVSLIAASTAAAIASVGLLSDPSMYGKAGPTLLVCVSILTLVASLVTSGLDYSGRSRDMGVNYRRVQRLSAQVERLKRDPESLTAARLEELHDRYDALLDESENHTEADFNRAFKGELGIEIGWADRRETALSVMPYVTLLAPIGLLVPLICWISR